jgi:RNA polymerase sigma-70 factor (ECF subfamily)
MLNFTDTSLTSADNIGKATLRDATLLERIGQGDSSALAEFYDQYARLVFSVALRITSDQEIAEEVTQDVFYDVWRSAKGFRPASGSGTTWLLSITRHRAIDTTRSRRYRARTHESSMDFEQPAGVEHEPQQQVQDLLTRELVRSALDQLPRDQRQALELAYYSGLSVGRIATQFGIPLGTIKTRLRLGLRKLRDHLAAHALDLG